MAETFKNAEYGIEALVIAGNEKFPFRAILRDADADATIQVTFGSYEQCVKAAKEFTK